MKEDLNIVYKYFSHHIRNSTAMIAASVTLLSYNMQTEDSNLVNEVVEASFLLDLFDAGMNICFCHLFDEPAPDLQDSYSTEANLMHFVDQCRGMLKERGVKLSISVLNPAVIVVNTYTLRTLTSVVIYEMMLQSKKVLNISLTGKILKIDTENAFEAPPVWRIIKNIMQARGLEFVYDGSICSLRFI